MHFRSDKKVKESCINVSEQQRVLKQETETDRKQNHEWRGRVRVSVRRFVSGRGVDSWSHGRDHGALRHVPRGLRQDQDAGPGL